MRQGRYLIISELPNGDLEIKATEQGIEFLTEDEFRDNGDAYATMFEDFYCNGSYYPANDFQIVQLGHLTSSPIILDHQDILESGELNVAGIEKQWYLPNYAIFSEMEKLKNDETIIFKLIK